LTYPIENTRYERLYLDAASATMALTAPTAPSVMTYDSLDEDGFAQFDYRFANDVDLVGNMKLALDVSADGDDMDLFVVLEKIDAAGNKVGFTHYAVFEDGPVAFGWLRVSRRELDPLRSTDWQPILANRRELKLGANEQVRAELEILPSGTHFAAGETLRIVIKGRDIYNYPKPMLYMHHEDTVNHGAHRLHTGGAAPAYLLVPVVKGTIA
jgi:predicted acyl esterase